MQIYSSYIEHVCASECRSVRMRAAASVPSQPICRLEIQVITVPEFLSCPSPLKGSALSVSNSPAQNEIQNCVIYYGWSRERAATDYMKIYILHNILHLFWTTVFTLMLSSNIPTYSKGVYAVRGLSSYSVTIQLPLKLSEDLFRAFILNMVWLIFIFNCNHGRGAECIWDFKWAVSLFLSIKY